MAIGRPWSLPWGPVHRATHSMAACFLQSKLTQVREDKKEPSRWKLQSFNNFVSEMISYYFFHNLLIRYVSKSWAHSSRGVLQGNWIPASGIIEAHLTGCLPHPPQHNGPDLVDDKKHETIDEKGNCKDIYLVSLSLLLFRASPKFCSKCCHWSKPILINFIVSIWISAKAVYNQRSKIPVKWKVKVAQSLQPHGLWRFSRPE